jgi:hypothetical protein
MLLVGKQWQNSTGCLKTRAYYLNAGMVGYVKYQCAQALTVEAKAVNSFTWKKLLICRGVGVCGGGPGVWPQKKKGRLRSTNFKFWSQIKGNSINYRIFFKLVICQGRLMWLLVPGVKRLDTPLLIRIEVTNLLFLCFWKGKSTQNGNNPLSAKKLTMVTTNVICFKTIL